MCDFFPLIGTQMIEEGRELQRDLTRVIDTDQGNIQMTEITIENIQVKGITGIIPMIVTGMIPVTDIANILVIVIVNILVIVIEEILEKEGEVLVLNDIELLLEKGKGGPLKTDLMKDADTLERTDQGKEGGILLMTDPGRGEDILLKRDTEVTHLRVDTGKGLQKERLKRRNQKIPLHQGRLQEFLYLCHGNI